MAQITDIIETLDELLSPGAFDDLGPERPAGSGHATRSREWSRASARGGSCSERAVELGAQLVLVHHGLFWKFHPTGLTPLLAERLRPLFKHDINLAAYHLPLDAHPELGNNAILARELGCDERRTVRDLQGPADRLQGPLRSSHLTGANFTPACARATGREPLLLGGRTEPIGSIGIVSGSAADTLHEAAAAGPRRVPDRRAARAHHR